MIALMMSQGDSHVDHEGKRLTVYTKLRCLAG